MKTLGLDLGSNSLGWALLENNQIANSGVVVFDEGISREKGNDSIETPAAARRTKRMGRRLKFRRKIRKLNMLKLLVENGMCPLTTDELYSMKRKNIFPNNPAYLDWLRSVPADADDHNPYYMRALSAEKPVPPLWLGRALYHLAQRRGFKSSRKDTKDSESEQKNQGIVKNDIQKLTGKIGNLTLGQYLYNETKTGRKIRGIHIGRVEHYQKEFEKIAQVQNISEPLKSKLFRVLFSQRPLRSQRFLAGKCPLEKNYSRCLIGHPLFEEYRMYSFLNTIRVQKSEDSELRFLSKEEREKLIPKFYRAEKSIKFSDLVKSLYPKKEMKNSSIVFNVNGNTSIPCCCVSHRLNKLLDMPYHEWRYDYSHNGKTVTFDYQTIFDALVFFDDDEKLKNFAINKLGFTQIQADEMLKINIPDGNAQYSLCAIRKILPFLKDGYTLSDAVFFAKIPELMGKDAFYKNREKILQDLTGIRDDYLQEKKTQSKSTRLYPLSERWKTYLEDTLHFSPDQLNQIYRRSESVYESCPNGILPAVNLGMLRNPLVLRSLTILRRLVNELRRDGIIDENTHIHVELARSVNNRNMRMAQAAYQKELEEERNNARNQLKQHLPENTEPSDDLIEKYLLQEEQGWKCLYTDKSINITELFSENSDFDIEHTVPRSRSGDNSRQNKTLCDRKFNRDVKKGCLPRELANWDEIDVQLRPWREKCQELETEYNEQRGYVKSKDQAEEKAKAMQKMLVTMFKLNYWKQKLSRFDATEDNLNDGFMNRQMVDTGIMTRHAVEFLRSVYPSTYCVNGAATAWARKLWGLQEPYEEKERTDHTHHAVDAMVIAALDREKFRQICTAFKDDGNPLYNGDREKEFFYAKLKPFPDFTRNCREAVGNILIKSYARHKELKQTWEKCTWLARAIKNKNGSVRHVVPSAGDTVRGQLHKETFYGKIRNPADNEEAFVIRKFIDEKSFEGIKDFEKIVDRSVREKVTEQVRKYMSEGKTFKEAVSSEIWMKEPDASGNGGVPIRKVRCLANIAEPHLLKRQLTPSETEYKNYYYVDSAKGSNFRAALFAASKKKKGVFKTIRSIYLDNLLEHVQTVKRGDYIPWEQRTDLGTFLGYIRPRCSVLLYQDSPQELYGMSSAELSKRLYKFVKIEKGGLITLRYHREARGSTDLGNFLKENGLHEKGESKICFDDEPFRLLHLSKSTYLDHALFENIDFSFSMGGQIVFHEVISE